MRRSRKCFLLCFVESKFVFFYPAHPFGDVVQEDIRLNLQNLLGARDLANRTQNPLDIISFDGGRSVDHVLDEFVAVKFVGGSAQGTRQLRGLLVPESGEAGERRPLVFGYEGHSSRGASQPLARSRG